MYYIYVCPRINEILVQWNLKIPDGPGINPIVRFSQWFLTKEHCIWDRTNRLILTGFLCFVYIQYPQVPLYIFQYIINYRYHVYNETCQQRTPLLPTNFVRCLELSAIHTHVGHFLLKECHSYLANRTVVLRCPLYLRCPLFIGFTVFIIWYLVG